MRRKTATFATAFLKVRDVAQPGSAPGLGPGGRRFESCHPDLRSQAADLLLGSFFICIISYIYVFCIIQVFGLSL
jgi:hypothetical protein